MHIALMLLRMLISSEHHCLPEMTFIASLTCAMVPTTLHVGQPWEPLNEGCSFHDLIRGKHGAGSTVLQFYTSRYGSSGSEADWLDRCSEGRISVNGQPVGANHLLRPGDKLTYYRPPWAEPEAPHELGILYEDEHLLVVNKPGGLQVLPAGAFAQRTVLTLLQQHHRDTRTQAWPGCQPPAPVHRLGRGTSGVLLCACSAEARKALAMDFTESTAAGASAGPLAHGAAEPRKLGKTYRALVQGRPEEDKGTVTVPIGRVCYPGVLGGLFAAAADGKPALTCWRVLEHREGETLLEVTIHTGRPHQIRIHMAAMGQPLVGDPLYRPGGVPQLGSNPAGTAGGHGDAPVSLPGDCGYHLHHMELSLCHPATKQRMTIRAPPPPRLCTQQELLDLAAGA